MKKRRARPDLEYWVIDPERSVREIVLVHFGLKAFPTV